MGRTVHQADLRRTLIDHVKRIRILESRSATGGSDSGEYVFLQETTVEGGTADEIVLADITQGYRHLALEASVSSSAGSGEPGDMTLVWAGATTYSDAQVDYDLGSGLVGRSFAVVSGSRIGFYRVLPPIGGFAGPLGYCMMTAKLPYYSLIDRAKAILWQASLIRSNGQPVTFNGGGQSIYDPSDPDEGSAVAITELTFRVEGGAEFAEGSRISLYGIA